MQDLVFHPHAAKFPMIEGDEYEVFLEDMKTNGQQQPILFRILDDGTRQGLDGRNRVKACHQLGIPSSEALVRVPDDKVIAFINSLNLYRRHQTIESRNELIWSLRCDGFSIRDIASAVGIGKSVVHDVIVGKRSEPEQDDEIPFSHPASNSVENSGDASNPTVRSPDTCEPEKVNAKNGKSYQSSMPKPKSQKPSSKATGEAPSDEEEEMVDEDGYAVPGRFRAFFAERKNMRSANSLASRLATLMQDVEKGAGYRQADAKREERLRFSSLLISLANLMRNIEFHSTHRACNGDGCTECGGKGWLMQEEAPHA